MNIITSTIIFLVGLLCTTYLVATNDGWWSLAVLFFTFLMGGMIAILGQDSTDKDK